MKHGRIPMVQVLDKGSVELINFMGGDLAVVAAARVSNGALYETASKGEEGDRKLIRFLMKHAHTSPFEHSIFTFYVKCPMFVRTEWHRHRTWSYNEVSGRYTEFNGDYYLPDRIRVQDAKNKQKSVFPGESHTTTELTFEMQSQIKRLSDEAYRTYFHLLSLGVARELARLVIPVNFYTSFYATVDAHNLMHFLSLRDHPNAQWEINEYARALKVFFLEKMPMTAEAYEEFRANAT